MRLILDENLPVSLLDRFGPEHETDHVERLGWKGLKNGELLRRISGQYDALLTGDTNLQHQQNLAQFDVAVIVIRPGRNLPADFVALIPDVLAALPAAPRGAATIVSAP
jgi:predicted nuclease of predicted toxin-antitoxin system